MASKEQFQSFYDSLVTKSNKKTTLFSNVSPQSYWNGSVRTGAGITLVQYTYFATENESAIELLIHRKNKDDNKLIFKELYLNKSDIEKLFGEELTWDPGENKKRCSIRNWFDDGGLLNPEVWASLHDKMVDAMIRFEKALNPYLAKIKEKYF